MPGAAAPGSTLGSRLAGQSRSYYGMMLAHVGVAIFIIGVTLVKGYEVETDVRMSVGDTTAIGGYVFRFDGVVDIDGPNYTASRGYIHVSKNGKEEGVMHPEKRHYQVQNMPMTEAAIDTGLLRDLYVSLGEPVSDGAWSVRIYYKPFVDWIWAGAFFMGLGGFLAVSDRRYRVKARKTVKDGSAGVDKASPQPAPKLATQMGRSQLPASGDTRASMHVESKP